MVLLEELFEICLKTLKEKKIFLNINYNDMNFYVPMLVNYYIVAGRWYNEIQTDLKKLVKDNENIMTTNELIKEVECECLSDIKTWGEDIYVSPIEKVCNCDLKFAYNLNAEEYEMVFDVESIKELEDKIIINLEKGEY